MSEHPHIYILGAGAIGCLWAHFLAEANIPSTLLLREERYCALADDDSSATLRVSTQTAQLEHRITLGSTARKYPADAAIEYLIVCTKAQDSVAALASLAPRLAPEAQILLLHNGLGPQQEAQQRYPAHSIFCGSTTEGAYLRGPLDLVHAGSGHTQVGCLNAPPPSSALLDVLLKLDNSLSVVDDIETVLWLKLAVNASINGLSALYQCKNGELLSNPQAHQHLQALSLESQSVLHKLGIKFPRDISALVCEVAQKTASNYSSTYQDVKNGRRTELPFINAYLLQQAKTQGLDLVEHRWLMQALAAKGIE